MISPFCQRDPEQLSSTIRRAGSNIKSPLNATRPDFRITETIGINDIPLFSAEIKQDSLSLNKHADWHKIVQHAYVIAKRVADSFVNVLHLVEKNFVHPFVLASATHVYLFDVGVSASSGKPSSYTKYPITFIGKFDLINADELSDVVQATPEIGKDTPRCASVPLGYQAEQYYNLQG